jgi:hypothetical protein
MKMNMRYTCSLLVCAGTFAASLALADEESQLSRSDPKLQEMMKKMEVSGTPAAGHKALQPLVGDWIAEVKAWMTPGEPPMVTRATAKSTWAMNGRFVQQEFNGEFMGKPFRGLSITGYDNTKQKFSNVWIDDMHTSMFTSEGKGDSGQKVITFEGEYDCPLTGEKNKPMKQVVRVLSKDKHVYEMHDPTLGANTKTMEITYTRK